MKSPFTGGETKLVIEPKELEFRKESFRILHHARQCLDTGEFFTTDALDQINVTQVHNRYREKHHLPFPDQIRAVRRKYDLSATKMSEILGFGINTYRNYESGEVPQASNAKLIKMAEQPAEFRKLVELNDTLSEKEEKKLKDRIDLLIEEEKESEEQMLKKLLAYAFKTPNVFTGYRDLDLDKFCNMIIYFAETIQPFKTKLNKLLFYTDFLHYKNTGFSISGCNYRAIELGPVPDGYDMLFDYFQRNERFTIEYVRFDNRENIGERFISRPQRTFDEDLFEETELQCLEKTARHFESADSEAIIQTSHKEQAWKKYRPENGLIAYDEAFRLKIDLSQSLED